MSVLARGIKEFLVEFNKDEADKFISRLINDKPSNRSTDRWDVGFEHGWRNALSTLNKELVALFGKYITQQGSVPLTLDRDKLARVISDNRGGHKGFPPAKWDYDEATAIISQLKDLLVVGKEGE